MIEAILKGYDQSLDYILSTVEEIPSNQLTDQPMGLVNHPAWTLAHLTDAAAFILELLDIEPLIPHPFDRPSVRFGSIPINDPSKYLPKDALLENLRSLHQQVRCVSPKLIHSSFNKQSPEAIRAFAPQRGDVLIYLLTAHEPYHLGPLYD